MPLRPAEDASVPALTVVVPVHNAERTLAPCLQAVFASEDLAPLEVIVVDDASTDASARIAQGFPCRLLRLEERRGPATARNRGAFESRSKGLAFVDADVLVQPGTLAALLASLPQATAAFATYAPEPREPGFATALYHALSVRSLRDTAERTTVLYSYCAVIGRETFRGLGGFDESFTRATFEDVELGLRLSRQGHAVTHRRDLEVFHLVRYTWGGLLRAYFRKSRDLAGLLLAQGKLTFADQGWTRRKNWAGLVAALATAVLSPFLVLGPAELRFAWLLSAAASVALALPVARELERRHPGWGWLAVPALLAVHVTAALAGLLALGERALALGLGASRGEGRARVS